MASKKASAKAKVTKAVTGKEPEVIESKIIADSATCVRASSKLRHHAKLLATTLASIKVFWADASDEAKTGVRGDLQNVAEELAAFLEE